MASHLADLSPERRALLQQRLRERTGPRPVPPDARLREAVSVAPLSFAQQGLWLMDQLEPGTPAFLRVDARRLRGTLDADALRAALAALARRYAVLRTVIETRDGEPVQVIRPPADVPLPRVDLLGLPSTSREPEARRLARAETLRPFDLSRGPLLRVLLLRLDEAEHVLVVCAHGIAGDDASMGVLWRDLAALYTAAATNADARLAPPPLQYADFARWQRTRLTDDVLRASLDGWKTRLSGAPPRLDLPTDRPPVAGQGSEADAWPILLPDEVTRAIRALDHRADATPFLVLLAAWQLFLGRSSGQDDVVIGAPVSGRARRELEGLMGPFANLLALRANLSGDLSFAGLVERVRAMTSNAHRHQDAPFERVVAAVGPARSLAHGPLVQATFALETADAEATSGFGDLRMEPFGEGAAATPHFLELILTDDGGRIAGRLIYRTALFDAPRIRRMADDFSAMLAAVVRDPDRPLREVAPPRRMADRIEHITPAREGGEGYVAPRTPAEEVLAAIWAEVLEVDRVGAEDDFFARGGHSFLALRAVGRIRDVFGVDLPLRVLFETPTAAGVARHLEATGASSIRIPPVRLMAGEGPHPLSYGQERFWTEYLAVPGNAALHLTLAVALSGPLDAAVLRRALTEVVRRHEPLRTLFEERDGAVVQVVLPPAPVPLPEVDLRGLDAAARIAVAQALAADDAVRPFDLRRERPLRATLLRLDAREWVVLFTLHHIAGDRVSTGILVREVSALYAAFAAGGASPLPEPEVRYADFARWQRAPVTGVMMRRQLRYWTRALEGANAGLTLGPPPAASPADGGLGVAAVLRVDDGAAAGLRDLGRDEGCSLFMVTLALWQALLGARAGQDDLCVGIPVAGRPQPELEGLIGFFSNSLVIRADLSGAPTFRELLRRVRRTTLRAYAHQDLPFTRLAAALRPEGAPAAPLFRAVFDLEHAAAQGGGEPPLAGLTLRDFPRAEYDRLPVRSDVRLTVLDGGTWLTAELVARATVLDEAGVERLARAYEALAAAVSAAPDRPLPNLLAQIGAIA